MHAIHPSHLNIIIKPKGIGGKEDSLVGTQDLIAIQTLNRSRGKKIAVVGTQKCIALQILNNSQGKKIGLIQNSLVAF